MKHFCMAPFTHIQLNPYGEINPCCIFDKRIYQKYDSLFQAFNSPENKDLRSKMIKDEWIEGCEKCYRDDEIGKSSYRKNFNSKYDKKYIQNPKIKELEFSASNLCNFKCMDCNYKFSSAIDGKVSRNSLPDLDLSELEDLKILGGEPFMDPLYLELFKTLKIENINLMIVTNNSIFPNEKWREYLTRFKSLNYNVSIDGISDVAEFVRYGTKWSRFEKNFDKQLKHFFVIPHYVFHTLNSTDLTDTIKWLESKGITNNTISYDFLDAPEWLNASYLPSNVKDIIINNNNNFLQKEIINFLKTNVFDKNYCIELINWMNKRDSLPNKCEEIYYEVSKCLRY